MGGFSMLKWLNRHQRGWGQVEWLYSRVYYMRSTGMPYRTERGLAYVRDAECGSVYPAEIASLKSKYQLTSKVRKHLGL